MKRHPQASMFSVSAMILLFMFLICSTISFGDGKFWSFWSFGWAHGPFRLALDSRMRPLADLRLLWAIRTPRRMGLRRFLAIRTHRYRAYARRVHSISTCVYFLLQLSLIYFIYSSSDSFQLDSPPPAVACSKLSFSLFSSCVQVHLEDELNVTIPIVLWISLQHSLPLAILHAYLSWAYGCILLAQQRSFLLPVVHVLFFS